MFNYQIYICDDEPKVLRNLVKIVNDYLLSRAEVFNPILKFTDPYKLIENIDNSEPYWGIYFLGVQLNDKKINGISLAQKIRRKDSRAKIIFITQKEDIGREILNSNVEAFAYISKNISISDLKITIIQALEKIIIQKELHNSSKEKLVITNRYIHLNIICNDIIFIETEPHHKVLIVTKTNSFRVRETLSKINSECSNLIQVSKSLLVNPQMVQIIDFNQRKICLKNKYIKYYSKYYSKNLKEALK